MGNIKFKRGTAANFAGVTLQAGEPAFVLDQNKLYIGNGTDKILINPDFPTGVTTAERLATARTISISGDGSGSILFDGTASKEITLTLANTGVSAGTYTKVTVDSKGRITSATNITASDIPSITLSKISDAGTAASRNTGTSSGNIPLIGSDGKLDAAIMPAITISDTFVVATESAMLALTAQVGDICIRTDQNKSYILKTAGASTLSNWQELLTPTSPVQSVAGRTGAVTLTSSDVGLGNVTNESKTTMFKNAALTGTPTAPTATAGANTTQIATTAFVTTAVANKTTITGNAGTATKLATARTISLTGDVVGSVSFDGSNNVSMSAKISVIDGGTF